MLATRGLVADVDRTPGIDVVDSDLRTMSLFSGSDADPATVTVRVESSTPAETLRLLLGERGFSSVPSVTPFHDDQGYFARARADSYDADLYRILDEDAATGTVTIGVSFFDTDSMLFAPIALVAGLALLAVAWLIAGRPFIATGPDRDAATLDVEDERRAVSTS